MTLFLSASEARRRLQVSSSIFKIFVEKGKIRTEMSSNKKQVCYREEDVQRIAQDMQSFMDMYLLASVNNHISVTQAQNENDIQATVHIGRQHFSNFTYSLETRLQWFSISPKGDYVLRHDGVVVGYFSMQAMKKEAIERIFVHKDGEVRIEDVVPIEAATTLGETLECYVSAVAVTTAGVRSEERRVGK